MRLARPVMSPDALATSSLLAVFTAAAVATTVLLVPGAQALATKHEVVVFDDGGLDPGVGADIDFLRGGVGVVVVGVFV